MTTPATKEFLRKFRAATKKSREQSKKDTRPFTPLPNIRQRAEYPDIPIERDMPECEAHNL